MGEGSLSVVDKFGTPITGLSPEQAAVHLARGARFQTATEKHEAEEEEKFGGTGGALAAAGLGAARGATFGLSDLALTHIKAGGEPLMKPETLEGYKKVNPISSTVGEVGSILLPMAGGVGRVLGKGVHAVEGLGELAAEGAEHLGGKIFGHSLGEVGAHAAAHGAEVVAHQAPGFLANLVTHSLPKVIGAGVEGAAYGVGNEISEASLGDHELTAEKLLAGAGKGFAISGGAMAGGLLAQAAVKKLMPTHLKDSIMGAINEKAEAVGASFDPNSNRKKFLGFASNEFNPTKGAKISASAESLFDKGLLGRGEQELNLATNKFEKLAESSNTLPSRARTLERIDTTTAKLNDHIDQVVNATDHAVASGAIDAAKMHEITGQLPYNRLDEIAAKIKDLRANGVSEQVAKKLDETVLELSEKIEAKGGSVAGLQELKKGIYDTINFEKMTMPKPEQIIRKDIARSIKEMIEDGTELARKSGALPIATAPVKELNRTLGDLIQVQKPLARAVGRADAYATAAGLRIRDLGLGSMGAMVGGGIGGPIGAAVGAGAGLVNRVMSSEKGYLLRAELADSFQQAHLRSMAKASGSFDKDVRQALGAFLASSSEKAAEVGKKVAGRTADKTAEHALEHQEHHGPSMAGLLMQGVNAGHTLAHPFTAGGEKMKGDSPQIAFKARSKELTELATNPDRAVHEITQANEGWRDSAPKVNDAVIAANVKALGFLYDKMPKDPTIGKTMSPNLSTWQPGASELDKWSRYVDAVRNPLSVLEGLKHGTVTTEQTEALKAVYPKIYSQVQQQIVAHVADLKEQLPYPKRLQIGTLFDVPADESQQPEFAASMRKLAAPVQPPKQGSPSHSTPKNHLATASMTQSQRAEVGGK